MKTVYAYNHWFVTGAVFCKSADNHFSDLKLQQAATLGETTIMHLNFLPHAVMIISAHVCFELIYSLNWFTCWNAS